MKISRALFTALALTLIASHAHALRTKKPATPPASVPEINPAMATGAFALLAGTGLIVRRGRVKA